LFAPWFDNGTEHNKNMARNKILQSVTTAFRFNWAQLIEFFSFVADSGLKTDPRLGRILVFLSTAPAKAFPDNGAVVFTSKPPSRSPRKRRIALQLNEKNGPGD
jgi:hypothetical protein